MIPRALSIMQPWAGLIVLGFKPVENRTWPVPDFMMDQRFLIHSSAKPEPGWKDYGDTLADCAEDFAVECGYPAEVFQDCFTALPWAFDLGCALGGADIIDCVQDSDSPWAAPGQYHWQLADVRPLVKPIKCRGALGFWKVPEDVLKQIQAERPEG